MNSFKEAQFIAQHINELENDMRAAIERGETGKAKILSREMNKLNKTRMRMNTVNN